MHRAIGLLVFGVALVFSPAAVRASVLVNTSLSLTQLQILPSFGSVLILPPFTASANAQAQDDLSAPKSQFNQVNGGATSATAATALASASAAASSLSLASLSASAASGVNIPGVTAFASSTGQGGLGGDFGGTGLFEIVSASTTSVSVTFNAKLSGSQSLTTNAFGQSATSEIIFNLLLPDIGSVVFFLDNPLSIGPSASLVAPLSTTLTNSVTLQTNTDYTLIAEVDAESSGLNTIPEPSSLFLIAFGLFVVLFASRALRNQRRSRKTA